MVALATPVLVLLALSQTGAAATSGNWAGYVVTGGPFTSVTATWRVPAVSAPPSHGSVSAWVGLNGYGDRTLEQVGTNSSVIGGVPHYSSWYEVIPRPAVPTPLHIAPGDVIRATVVADTPGTFTFTLQDLTTGASFTTHQSAPRTPLSSAEVITEAPSVGSAPGSIKMVPLARFAPLRFSGIAVNGRPLSSFRWTRVTMDGARSTLAAASPLPDRGTAFTVTWRHH
jgi:hypothetical protein